MNTIRVNQAIAIMERAKLHDSICMKYFQPVMSTGELNMDEASLHACGNKACFAGHIAISPEFKADGGTVNEIGAPVFNNERSSRAVAQWLEIPNHLAYPLVINYNNGLYSEDNTHAIYGIKWSDIKADDVLKVLFELRDHGVDFLLEKLKDRP